jgi:proteasome lid subunit RPN8/RPN11
MQPLTIERGVLDAMLAHARETHPEECCGALVRRAGKTEVWRLENVQNELHRRDPAANPRTAATAYALGAKDLERVDAASAGDPAIGTLAAIYHSHTKVGAYFSGEDRARAMFVDEPLYPDIAWVVVSDSRETGEARAFRWDEARRDFVEVSLDVR